MVGTRQDMTLSRRGSLKVGCLVVLVILIVAIAAGVWYVRSNWRGWGAQVMQAASEGVVAQSGLPDDQKNQILAQVRSLGDDFKAGKITTDQMQHVMQEIVQSPLLPLAAVQAAKQKYVEPSDMTPDEKAAAIRSLQRYARGVYEQKIPRENIDDVIKPISTLKPDGRWELKSKPSRLELDQFVANAKAKADEAKIPDEPFDLNIADELKKAIDKALGRTQK